MLTSLLLILESILLVSALSLDAFVASIGYGSNKIKIPFASVMVISVVCSSFLAISLLFGSVVKKFIPGSVTSIISFLILILLGIYNLFQSLVKNYIKKNSSSDKRLKIKLFDLRVVIDIYVDETKADFDHSNNLNPKEALYLATALSLDSLAVGFGSSLGTVNYIEVILLSFFTSMVAIWLGLFIGRKFAEKSKVNISWLSGALLIILAIMKIK